MLIFQKLQRLFIRNLITFFFISVEALINKLRPFRKAIAFLYDSSSILLSWLLACYVVVSVATYNLKDTTFIGSYWVLPLDCLSELLPLQLLAGVYLGLYRGIWRFASIQDLKKIIHTSLLGGLLAFTLLLINKQLAAYNSLSVDMIYHCKGLTSLLYVLFLIISLSSGRLFARFTKNFKHLYSDYKRVIIVGAGDAGEGLVRDLLRDNLQRYKPIAFVDDDLAKLGREIHSVRVLGTITELPNLIKKYNVELVLIAIPSASSANMRSVFETCEKAGVNCHTLPSLKDLADGRVNINILRSISLEDLIGRYPITCQWEEIKKHLENKTVLITGGGGSIGSELCRQLISKVNIKHLLIIDSSEYNLYTIEMELKPKFPHIIISAYLLSVTDRVGINSILTKHKPEIVFHAAAYKHVPMLENQPRTAVHNNIIGTAIMAEEAVKMNVETFVLISSDKAVNPTNIMGATKRAAEYFCQNLNATIGKTKFITVRFGNVLGSAGSVIPLFKKQIKEGGPVTVTHPDILRFFMTIPEASQLILQAASLGNGGEIFVLDMGDPVKIRYLAEQMIKLAGKKVDQDIPIVYTGLRPGEKLYEECFYANETLQATSHPKILRAQSRKRDFDDIKNICFNLESLCYSSVNVDNKIIALLNKLVPEYHSTLHGNSDVSISESS